MKIQTIKIKKFKALENFEADINGNNIFLCGDNAVGKSTIIQACLIALGDQSNIPPTGTGEWIVVTTKENGTYQFRVKIKDGKSVVEIVSPDGLKDTKKGTLAALIGAVNFNIDEFVRLSETTAGQKKQVEIYKSFLDPEIIKELDGLKAKVKSLEVDRTETGREEKRLKAVIESHPLRNEIDLGKFKEVDTVVLLESLNKANKRNEDIKNVKAKVIDFEKDIEKRNEEIELLKSKIAALENINKQNAENVKGGKEWLEKNTTIDTTDIQTQINDASEINKKAALAKQLKADQEAHAKSAEEYGTATANIESQKEEISRFIKEMAVPVDGLMFDDDMLIYKNIPVSLSTLSTSEIMELGVLMKIAENKGLGVLFLEHGESLGAQRLKDIQEIAAKNNMQLIIEQVERGKDLHIEIMEA
jgi:predicted ATP-dependent endonuclease of OLD family